MGFSGCKRKRREDDKDTSSTATGFAMDELNDDILEKVLSWLPTSTFFRLSFVCKRWKSMAESRSFKLACSQIRSRDPWFFMVDSNLSLSFLFDSSDSNWRNLSHCPSLPNRNLMPVASSGGLLCLRHGVSGDFLVVNPVTGASREVPPLISRDQEPLHAVAMTTKSTCHDHSYPNYKLIAISGEMSRLSFRVYDSRSGSWGEEEIGFAKNVDDFDSGISSESDSNDENGTVYFLSKAGNVMATNLQRNPSKQYSSVITLRDGEEIVYFFSPSGSIVSCNITKRSFTELPRLLPPLMEYSIDMVECNGNMFVILLSEFFESSSLRVWRLDEKNKNWVQVAMMPPAMSHELFGKKGDINCVGTRGRMLVCFNSPEMFRYFTYDLVADEWSELPRCFKKDNEAADFVSALAFEPRIEVSV
ncbi:PREDICTED: F-box only protein 13 [Tarenaya hassleriana]|uniref:F-box only protein 13 n=1 Tax=Tarenaya hassleriana TaxID=28532 RepID=UPI00053C4B9D|nr:PREDICTED: F-box only protein 13 [Tarenaya hassleriana]